MKNIIKGNKLFVFVFCFSLIIHLISLFYLGINYSINSDDVRYIECGIDLFKTHTLMMYGTKTVQIMPGLPFLISIIYGIVRSKTVLNIILKILYIMFSLISLTYLYKIIKMYANKNISALCSALLLI